MAIHAAGDKGIDQALTAMEAANAETPIKGKLWAIEHGFVITPAELKRMKALVRKVTGQSLAIIRRHGAVRRAASRARLPTAGSSGSGSSRSSGTASRT